MWIIYIVIVIVIIVVIIDIVIVIIVVIIDIVIVIVVFIVTNLCSVGSCIDRIRGSVCIFVIRYYCRLHYTIIC